MKMPTQHRHSRPAPHAASLIQPLHQLSQQLSRLTTPGSFPARPSRLGALPRRPPGPLEVHRHTQCYRLHQHSRGSVKQAATNNCRGDVWPDCVNMFEGVTKRKEQCEKHNVCCTTDKWRRFQRQAGGQRGGNFGRSGSGTHQQGPGRDGETINGVSNDKDSGESQPETPRIIPLTAAKISEWNSAWEKIFSDVEKCDPTPDCSLTFKRLTSTTFIPYSERRKDLRQKAEWMRLKQFLQPVWEGKLLTPSTSCESQTWGVEVPDPRGRHTDILLFCPRSVTALPWL